MFGQLNLFDPADDDENNEDWVFIEFSERKLCGVYCIQCKEFYPYSFNNQIDGTFKCWGCINY
jgi:hypothetical protein